MLRRLVGTFAFLVAVAVAAGVGGYVKLTTWAGEPHLVVDEQIVDVAPGTTLATLSTQLADRGIVSSGQLFQLLVRLQGTYPRFQAGKYRFAGRTPPQTVIDAMVRGDIYRPVVLTVTIPEGFTMRQVVERLAANQVGSLEELKRLTTDRAFLQSVGVDAPSVEGYLYPATYTYAEMPTAARALEGMVKTFWQNVPKDYAQAVGTRGLTLHQAVIFASLIELETRYDDERSLVSEVIWARLKDGVPLGIDATIIYGIEGYAGDIKSVHLTDANNLYNTRIHKGLPPGPIGSPSIKSLAAVLEPSNFGYYYYVLKPNSDRHHFSKTLKEHNQHVKKLVESYRGNRAKLKPQSNKREAKAP